jgi:hypothetical protein
MSEIQSSDGIQIEKDNKVNIILDMSQYDLFTTCACRYDYRYNKNKATVTKAKALDLGGVMHEGFEVYFNMLKDGKPYQDRMHSALLKIKIISADPDQSQLEPEEVDLLLKVFEQTCDYWRYEDETLEILEVERAFVYVLYEDDYVRIIISGKIDLIVNIPAFRNSPRYEGIPYDHKSFSRDGEVLRLNNQFMNYCSAVNSDMIRINRVGLHDPDAKKPKPAEEKFKRITLSYDPIILADWRMNLTRVILDRYLESVRSNFWPQDFTSCLKFNRKCEYYEVCDSSGIEAKLFKLSSGFASVSPWDVTAKLKKS